MTVYNALATGSGGRTFDEIAKMTTAWSASSRIVVPRSQIREAVAQLYRRKFVQYINGLYDVTDPKRRPVVERDRSDEGQTDAGWRGWRVHARPVAAPHMVALEDVIR